MISVEDLVQKRWPPIFDYEIMSYMSKLLGHEEASPDIIRKRFIEAFDFWIHDTRLNNVEGLQAFRERDFCVGVTGFLDDLYVRYGPSIRYFKREYSYHRRLAIGLEVEGVDEIGPGCHLIISSPFCLTGGVREDMPDILDFCQKNDIHVHIDSAWYGCVREFTFDYNHPSIKSVGFSLSKGISSGHNRIGIRYSRERSNGPITIVNDFNMGVVQLMWMGIKMMEKYSCDFMQDKYAETYNEVCQKLNLLNTPAIHLAYTSGPDSQPVGVGPLIQNLTRNRGLEY